MFTDKTGTLTENNMEFIECCVDGNVYIPHAICNGQILSAASSIDMIDSSPGGYRRVSLFICLKENTILCDRIKTVGRMHGFSDFLNKYNLKRVSPVVDIRAHESFIL